MVASVEILRTSIPELAQRVLDNMQSAIKASGCVVKVSREYRGDCDLLMLYGVGATDRSRARDRHQKSGRHVVTWDQAYFGRKKIVGYLRCSLDHDHPQKWLEGTAPDPSRLDAHNIKLREDADPNGHILLVGMGRKSHTYLRITDWEALRLKALQTRFPGRSIIYRPKPGSPPIKLKCAMNILAPIEMLLKGAALVSCRHSNVAVDAIIAGVPFECDDGAAIYLQGRPYTPENRLDFLRRLAWWQWNAGEAPQAWKFLQARL